LEPLQGVDKLHSCFEGDGWITGVAFSGLDCEPDLVDCYTDLVGHLEVESGSFRGSADWDSSSGGGLEVVGHWVPPAAGVLGCLSRSTVLFYGWYLKPSKVGPGLDG